MMNLRLILQVIQFLIIIATALAMIDMMMWFLL